MVRADFSLSDAGIICDSEWWPVTEDDDSGACQLVTSLN